MLVFPRSIAGIRTRCISICLVLTAVLKAYKIGHHIVFPTNGVSSSTCRQVRRCWLPTSPIPSCLDGRLAISGPGISLKTRSVISLQIGITSATVWATIDSRPLGSRLNLSPVSPYVQRRPSGREETYSASSFVSPAVKTTAPRPK